MLESLQHLFHHFFVEILSNWPWKKFTKSNNLFLFFFRIEIDDRKFLCIFSNEIMYQFFSKEMTIFTSLLFYFENYEQSCIFHDLSKKSSQQTNKHNANHSYSLEWTKNHLCCEAGDYFL